MTEFDTRFAARAGRRLLGDTSDPTDLGRFGEWITYRPLNGKPRRIRAMVDRDPPEFANAPSPALGPHVAIEVYNDATHGINSRTLNTGGDTIELDIKEGQCDVTLTIKNRMSRQDIGLLKLECF